MTRMLRTIIATITRKETTRQTKATEVPAMMKTLLTPQAITIRELLVVWKSKFILKYTTPD